MRLPARAWIGPFLAWSLWAGSNTTLQVFDQRTYEARLQESFGAYLRLRDAGPLKRLLEETLRELEAHPLPSRWPGDEEPRAVFRRALGFLEGRPGGEEHLVMVVEGGKLSRAEAVRNHVQGSVLPRLVEVLCLVRRQGRLQELNLWDSPLAAYLYARSPWIKAHFDGMVPGTDAHFEISPCESTDAIAPWFAADFLRELEKVPRPAEPRLAEAYDLLLGMLRACRNTPAFRLVMEVC